MRVVYDPQFYEKLKKLNARIRKSFKKKILLFLNNPNNPQLNNHLLKREYSGYRSIDITSDWRAIYKETKILEKTTAYFVKIGTHDQLYTKKSTS